MISLAAGVPTSLLLRYIANAKTVGRIMANTPATIQKGLFGIYFSKKSSQEAKHIIKIFSHLGEVTLLKNDSQVNAITSGSASGVGFVFSFIEEFEKWFVRKGFSSREARRAAVETFLGAAMLAKTRENMSLKALRLAVTSKKGTTLAGLNAMRRAKVGAGLRAGLDGGYRRGAEIAKSLLRSKK